MLSCFCYLRTHPGVYNMNSPCPFFLRVLSFLRALFQISTFHEGYIWFLPYGDGVFFSSNNNLLWSTTSRSCKSKCFCCHLQQLTLLSICTSDLQDGGSSFHNSPKPTNSPGHRSSSFPPLKPPPPLSHPISFMTPYYAPIIVFDEYLIMDPLSPPFSMLKGAHLHGTPNFWL